jgi:peptide chain release factor 1
MEQFSIYQKYAKKKAQIEPIIEKWEEYKKIEIELNACKQVAEDKSEEKELREMAMEEIKELTERKNMLISQLQKMIITHKEDDKYKDKNVIMEIRAGTGGEESALFVADLFRMYSRYAQDKGWKIDVLSSNPTDIGGFKEIIFSVEGDNVYSRLKFESGTHRVQRVPETEASGRIHTSAATVAVLLEPDEIEVNIKPEDLRIDVYRATGCGGQHVNTTDSAVRITHLPTGIVVTCQDERSQHKNKAKAMKVLRAKLYANAQAQQQMQISKDRKMQIGSGDRSEKIRTYNYPQNRVTDHRIGLTLYKLEDIMDGAIDDIIDALAQAGVKRELKRAS